MPQDTEPDRVAQALAELRDKASQYRAAAGPEARQAARTTLHQAVALTVKAGAKQAQAAQASGLSKAQVSRVARGASSGRAPLPPATYLIDSLPAAPPSSTS